jgi:PadR family transcriptional regulator, regulatory protein PadR
MEGSSSRDSDLSSCSDSGRQGQGRYRQAMLQTAALVCLVEGELHGYELVERIDAMVGAYVCVDPGSTYRLLRDLEGNGYLVSAWQPGETGPVRRTYQVTPAGRELLGEWAVFLEKRARVMNDLADRARELLSVGGKEPGTDAKTR